MNKPRTLALAAALIGAGLSQAAAQFPPPPGQGTQTQSNPFPPPPGQQGSNPFPPAPGQQGASPFPPAPGQQSSAPAQPSRFPPPQQQQPGGGQWPPPQARPSGPGSFPPPGAMPGSRSICETFPEVRAQVEKDGAAIKAATERKAPREEVCVLFTKFTASEGRMAKFLESNQAACGVPPDAVKQVKGQHAKTQQLRKQICSAGPGPRGPSLSDALGGPVLSDEPPKPGRGTFDTLTGPVFR